MPSGATAYLSRCDWIQSGTRGLCSTSLCRHVSLSRKSVLTFERRTLFGMMAFVSGCLAAFRVRMAAMFTCCLGCCGDGASGHIPLKEMPTVQLDTHHMGTDVVIVKSGRRICGTGGCLANAPLHQNKSYFEFKIQSTGVWGIGVATQKVNLNQVPLGRDTNSLVLRHDGSVYHNNEEKNRLPANSLPQEGDIVGVTYDHVELNLYLNGKNMHCPASGIRGTVFPVVYVDDSAILDCQFSDFYHTAPHGFEKILFEQQIF
ncbi:LOW QUALITY PROTEIN: SPRY domain-containing protein 7b [Tautogolabrus adspersus]